MRCSRYERARLPAMSTADVRKEQLSAPFASLSLLEFDRSCVSNDEWQNPRSPVGFFDEDFIYNPWCRGDWENRWCTTTAGELSSQKMHIGLRLKQTGERFRSARTQFLWCE